jgi:hypothetical protein
MPHQRTRNLVEQSEQLTVGKKGRGIKKNLAKRTAQTQCDDGKISRVIRDILSSAQRRQRYAKNQETRSPFVRHVSVSQSHLPALRELVLIGSCILVGKKYSLR